ncbi:type VI secretion protein IcmF/TssM N-terminal domain-containing protein [Chitinasiproducens palmae]|uniref:Type VI secretion system protein ImpL n=1 Tax=Chitinasiproducens palmae TaxID=1770053 RepID=A0A1H2PL15_9BURK|nr:type VI secretion protein IcmF/TssM N-terminal domain-containing protein [Chitinasiproducens palmae]SDV47123.1 type VI secretion system protein ImpL [Chitinasiproducens palmae]
MKAFRTVLLWLVALVLLALVSWGVTLYLEWPLWASAALFFGALGLFFLVKFVRRVLLALRSRSVIARQRRSEREAARRASPVSELRRKFRHAVMLLRGSSLKRLGNPLYALPWYLVIGRPGAGKTTALTRSRLATSIQDRDTRASARIASTENCDWWYFDKSVVLDCAGRYVDSDNDDVDRREWDVVLDLLSRYRGREGINGLVLAISADRLLAPNRDELDEEARVIRARIEQLIRLFGKRFPVYLLVTKCDRLYGFEKWSALLPPEVLDQAIGYLASDNEHAQPRATFMTAAFQSIVSRLRALRIALVGQHPDAALELLLFPNELERLQRGLTGFVDACLGESPYLESPFVRGIFFSSGLQEGGARSVIMPETVAPVPAHPPSNTGLFLHDLFGRILPGDRNLSKPAALVNRWFAATQHLGLLAWLLISIAIGILMTASFIQNVKTLNYIQNHYPFRQQFTGRLADDAATLSLSNEALREIDRRNDNWRMHWMAASDVLDLEERLRRRFVDQYRTYIRPAVEQDLDSDLKRALVNDPEGALPLYILAEIRTTNLLRRKLAGADRDELAAMPQPLYADNAPYSPALFDQINQLRLSYYAWSPVNAAALIDQVNRQQVTLTDAMYRDNMHWLTHLVHVDPQLQPVRLADFWLDAAAAQAHASVIAQADRDLVLGASDPAAARAAARAEARSGMPDAKRIGAQVARDADAEQLRLSKIMVPAAYTRDGLRDIQRYIDEAHEALDDDARLDREANTFWQNYVTERFQIWQNFVQAVPEGERLLSGRDAWQAKLAGIGQASSPYLRALDRLNDDFAQLPDAQLPDWLKTARRVGKLRREATGALLAGKTGELVQTINAFGGQALKQTIASSPSAGAQELRVNAQAAGALRDYLATVSQIAATVTEGEGKAYEVSAAFHGFGIDPAIKTSAVQNAARALARFRTTFESPQAAEQAVWRLVGGPLHFVLAYSEQQTSCALQTEWEGKVYWPLQSATSLNQIIDQLYGPQGSVWGFVDGPAKPFLRRSADTIAVVETAGYSVPFTEGFLPTLNSAIGKRVAQLLEMQRAKARTEQEQLQAQAAQDLAKQQQASAEQALTDVKQKIAAAQAKAYPLGITGQPTDVNPGARVRPFATVLTIQCASGARTLSNFNFPVSDHLNWAPGQCGEVSLVIRIEGVTLSKRYRGDMGMVNFLRDFRDGHHLFTADDFPSSRPALAARNITQITVRYDFDGADAIVDGAQQVAQLQDEEARQVQARQAAVNAQAAQTQQLMLIKMASANGAPERPVRVALPQRIGMCWNAQPGTAPPSLKQMFDSLLDTRGPLVTAAAPPQPLPAFAPPSAPDMPPLPPMPTVPNTSPSAAPSSS